MSEFAACLVAAAAVAALAAVSMLHLRVEREARNALDTALRRVAARLCGSGSARPARGERGERGGPPCDASERRAAPRRRLEDLLPSRRLRRLGA